MSIEGDTPHAVALTLIRRFCAACGSIKDLHEHHLVPRVLGGVEGPTVTLCASCHRRAHNLGHSILTRDLRRAKVRGAVTIDDIEAELATALAVSKPGALTPVMVMRLRAPTASGEQEIVWDQTLEGFGVLISGKVNTKQYIVQAKHGNRRRPVRVKIGPTNVFTLDDARDRASSLLARLVVGELPKRGRLD